jgi:hypothetical protein
MGKMCVNLQAGENGKKESLTLTVTPRATEMTIPREPDIIHEIFCRSSCHSPFPWLG